jgi:hypothetical protein
MNTSKTSIGLESAGSQKSRRLKQTWKRTIMEEAGKCSETWNQVRYWQDNTVRWRFFTNM